MNEFNEIINNSKPTLVDFFAVWCQPCSMQAPILEEVKRRVGDSASIIKIDIEKNDTLAQQYNVRSVPTIMLFKEGKMIWRESGLQQADTLEHIIKANL